MESAVVVKVALPAVVARFRAARVPMAPMGLPPHVTLLYPFVAPMMLDANVKRTVREIAASERPFAITLGGTIRWPGVACLLPDPVRPFERLADALESAFPDLPPYGGDIQAFSLVPHVTVSERDDEANLDLDAAFVRRYLPIAGHVTGIRVLTSGEDGRWRTRWSIPLGQ